MEKESIFKTLSVAVGVCAVCAVLVSIAAVALKPVISKNKVLGKKSNVLVAAGLINADGYTLDAEGKPTQERADVTKLFTSLVPQAIDLKTGKTLDSLGPEEIAAIDERELVKKKETRLDIAANDDTAKIKTTPDKAVIYLLKDENGTVKRYIFPFYGQGLWSTMYGFIALDGDLNTVENITFYDQEETPGLGGEIAKPFWQSKWSGKSVYDPQGNVAVSVIKGTGDPTNPKHAFEVDGISGATLTGAGVGHAVQFWLGKSGFGPYIKSQKE
ncbi:MAG: Na(+)-translocating NADH-quinone reductase subunit C [Planctomycetaceae bacterium]|jgi:Na+-transporting NADH:ubiquinone oxidoreductase subunit C|nr:Na(+)-translocating NADH-quinone reductase subunit C [Planctomycetaceae bacterium]